MKWKRTGVCLCLILSGAALGWIRTGSAQQTWEETHEAAMTEPEAVMNHFRPGRISIRLTEPSYLEGQMMIPGETITKDPTVTNTGDIKIYAFMEVRIPMAPIRTVSDPYSAAPPVSELLRFTPSGEWRMLQKETTSAAGEENPEMRYIFGLPAPLQPGEQSVPLFSSLSCADYLEGELENGSMVRIPVTAYAIQAEGFAGLEEAWARQNIIMGGGSD